MYSLAIQSNPNQKSSKKLCNPHGAHDADRGLLPANTSHAFTLSSAKEDVLHLPQVVDLCHCV